MTLPTSSDHGQQALTDALGTSFRLLRYGLLILGVCYLCSGIFMVQPSERAFVLTFGSLGQPAEAARKPGLHVTWPRPFTSIERIPFDTTQSVQVDTFWNPPPPGLGNDTTWAYRPRPFSYAISGDVNLMHSQWAVHYQVQDAEIAAFRMTDLATILRYETERAVVHQGGQRDIEKVLRTDVDAFRNAVESQVQQRVQDLNLGLRVQRIDLMAGAPPWPVLDAFDTAALAEQERSRTLSQARTEAARVTLAAKAESAAVLSRAQTARERGLAEVRADADYFERILEKHQEQGPVLLRTLLQDTLRRTLKKVDEKYVIHESATGTQEIRLLLGPERNKKGP